MNFKKGLVLLNPQTQVENGEIKKKFFLLMEGPSKKSESLIVFMTTSKKIDIAKDRERRGVLIDIPFLKKPKGLVLLHYYRDVPIKELKRDYQIKGVIDEIQLETLTKAIKRSKFLPAEIKSRVLQKKFAKPQPKATYQPFAFLKEKFKPSA